MLCWRSHNKQAEKLKSCSRSMNAWLCVRWFGDVVWDVGWDVVDDAVCDVV